MSKQVESNMEFILLSPEGFYQNEHSILQEMLKLGLKQYHLRKPEMEISEMQRFVKGIPPEFHSSLVLHGNPDWVKHFPIKNVHLKEHQKPPETTFNKLGKSVHFLPDLNLENSTFDYLFLSPVYSSISKPGYGNAFSKQDLQIHLKKHKQVNPKQNVYALGGVTPDHVAESRELGFDGVVALGGVWNQDDPLSQVEKFLAACQN